jgi:hypothetical protein
VEGDFGCPFFFFLSLGGGKVEEDGGAPLREDVGGCFEVDGLGGVADGGEVLGREEDRVRELVLVGEDWAREGEVGVKGAVVGREGGGGAGRGKGGAEVELQGGVKAGWGEKLGREARLGVAVARGEGEHCRGGVRVLVENREEA